MSDVTMTAEEYARENPRATLIDTRRDRTAFIKLVGGPFDGQTVEWPLSAGAEGFGQQRFFFNRDRPAERWLYVLAEDCDAYCVADGPHHIDQDALERELQGHLEVASS
jgi:hypothetical protein